MEKLKVGSIVKGKVREPMLASSGGEVFNTLDFTGKVRSLQMITVQGSLGSSELGKPDEGVVAIKLLSDQYLAPGTSVTGMVAGKIFKGTVTKAPSMQDRLDEAEKRIREAAPPVCDEMCELNKGIRAAEHRIADFKASRKMRKEAAALEKRVAKIEHPAPPPETVSILGNWAGFKFDLPQGPDVYGARIKDMKARLAAIPKGYVQAVEPLYEKTRGLEKKLDQLEGLKTVRERIDLLRKELGDAELCTQYVEPQAEATPEDLEDRKKAAACIESVVSSNKFKTYAGKEAEEEKEKEQFLKPEMGGDEGAEGGESEEEEAEEKGRQQSLHGTGSSMAMRKHAAHRQQLWAPGQRKVWEAYLAKTDKMNGVASDEDNVIAQWA